MQNEPDTHSNAEAPAESDAAAADTEHKRLKPRQLVASVFAAGLGIQSSKNRERDFKEGSAGMFIVAGLVFTAMFIGGVYLLVRIVLETAG